MMVSAITRASETRMTYALLALMLSSNLHSQETGLDSGSAHSTVKDAPAPKASKLAEDAAVRAHEIQVQQSEVVKKAEAMVCYLTDKQLQEKGEVPEGWLLPIEAYLSGEATDRCPEVKRELQETGTR